ncbi:OPT oligopeptide transporter protein-domain-containing protein [Epithele typhae]|uniref:OPT oligopeptide transporter protein-domain-containing protein n=1 Tax=Epithele typhae TaxID=378194 RepID=UPI002007470C|nr:OPT oligopeptide transporter protein-domain-containing protein [Epithele typhae]KAH9933658.1 OPT oligopeptide transporter protein-domain-containing protein [Epithele typhae]
MSLLGWLRSTRPARRQASDEPLDGSQTDFTLRAVLLGLLIGCLLCFTNLYFGLQTGWISMMSLQSALIGFLMSKLLRRPMTPQENVVLQTTAVATGTMPLAAGFVGILPALGLLDEERDGVPPVHLSWIAAVGWSCAVAFFGVFLSPPLRKQVIIEEQLAFPSGTATGQLISVLHQIPPPNVAGQGVRRRAGYRAIPDGDEAPDAADEAPESTMLQSPVSPEFDTFADSGVEKEGWGALGWSFAASGVMTLAAYFFPVIFAIPLFGQTLASEWLWTFTPSLSYIGQGIIMGLPTTLSMNLGMLVGWGILSPLSKHMGWAPGPVGDMTTGARGWILWVSLAIMCADSLVSLVPVVAEVVSTKLWPAVFGPSAGGAPKESNETETEDRLVPMSWVLWGLGGSVVLGTFLVWLVFGDEGIKPWATVIGFVLGALLSVLGVRALGETDLNPVSGLGKISQLLFAWLQPGNVVANIIAGAVAEAGAQQAGDLMQDLKTGHLVRASPRAQFYGQLIGSCLSILVTTTAYSLYQRAYEIPGPSFPAPTAYVWLGLARLLRDGALPPHAAPAMALSALLFGALAGLKARAARAGRPHAAWLPSGVAFAIGFLNTPAFSLARLVGGVVEHWYYTRRGGRERAGIRLVVVASGFVLGEGVVSIVALGLRTAGVGVAGCWGCGHGLCGGCPA